MKKFLKKSVIFGLMCVFTSVACSGFAASKRIRKFTPEQDEIIRVGVERLGYNWKEIANQFLPGVKPKAIRDRWNNYLASGIDNNREWTEEEKKLLVEKYKELGPKWSEIASFFKNRSAKSIRNKFVCIKDNKYFFPDHDFVVPDAHNACKWTAQEEKLLIEKYKEFGLNWDEIAKYFPNRTKDSVIGKFNRMRANTKK